jgi:hypothetical protein
VVSEPPNSWIWPKLQDESPFWSIRAAWRLRLYLLLTCTAGFRLAGPVTEASQSKPGDSLPHRAIILARQNQAVLADSRSREQSAIGGKPIALFVGPLDRSPAWVLNAAV